MGNTSCCVSDTHRKTPECFVDSQSQANKLFGEHTPTISRRRTNDQGSISSPNHTFMNQNYVKVLHRAASSGKTNRNTTMHSQPNEKSFEQISHVDLEEVRKVINYDIVKEDELYKATPKVPRDKFNLDYSMTEQPNFDACESGHKGAIDQEFRQSHLMSSGVKENSRLRTSAELYSDLDYQVLAAVFEHHS